ncbi:unnamed protein product [Ostreobium quekettii]|uniref:BZIP domain-containing protein n=1 Tax=Ostreobium quekettii TaxID=121088 RepID=A0A8S1IVZ9_9CHLO|nr:unnamed protein product [Ostreobium quekettii]|eukprot:evm.model.scf_1333EXC.1 EVM.evm.TU.scf_1333EXC.1   scf_1333EXC:4681-8252(-)
MDRVTAGPGGVAPHLISPEVDMTGFSEDDLRFLVLRSRLHSGEMPMQGGQGLLAAEHAGLSRPSPQLASGIPGTVGVAAPGAGLMGPQGHPSAGPLLLGTGGMQGQQAAQTLAVSSNLLFDNYKALSGVLGGGDPLKRGLLQQAGTVEHTPPGGVGSPDSPDLQAPNSEEQILRTQKKREKNRIAQQRFRLRQKQLVSDLQDELSKKSREIDDLRQTRSQVEEENKVLRKALEQMDVDVEKVLQYTESPQPQLEDLPSVAPAIKQEDDSSQSKGDDSMSRDPIDALEPVNSPELL